MTEEIKIKGTQIVWQSDYEGDMEYPIVIIPHDGSISIGQEGRTVSIHPSRLEEIIKALRKAKKQVEGYNAGIIC